MKTISSMKKRFKYTGSGKIKCWKSGFRHNLTIKTNRSKTKKILTLKKICKIYDK